MPVSEIWEVLWKLSHRGGILALIEIETLQYNYVILVSNFLHAETFAESRNI
jgi:hypothetical protein